MAKPRMTLTRVHQVNGPDYWQADCYIANFMLSTYGSTQREATVRMWTKIDDALWYDWNWAHSLNKMIDDQRAREKKAQIAANTRAMEEHEKLLAARGMKYNTDTKTKGFWATIWRIFK